MSLLPVKSAPKSVQPPNQFSDCANPLSPKNTQPCSRYSFRSSKSIVILSSTCASSSALVNWKVVSGTNTTPVIV